MLMLMCGGEGTDTSCTGGVALSWDGTVWGLIHNSGSFVRVSFLALKITRE